MKTAWYSSNASVEEIVKVLKQYPSYKTSIFEDIVSQKEKIYLNNPIEVDGSNELFERLYLLKKSNLKKEHLVELYENYIGNIRPIWVVEDFDGPAIVAKQYGPYMVIFFNENPKDY